MEHDKIQVISGRMWGNYVKSVQAPMTQSFLWLAYVDYGNVGRQKIESCPTNFSKGNEMRDRLLNPKRFYSNLESLNVITIDNESYRTFTKQYDHVNNGSCQCFADCDCYENKGEITAIETTWYRNIKFDGTDRCFYSEPYTPKDV